MFKQLFLSTALATAFAATPVLADDHEKHNKDDSEWEQKTNQSGNHADKKSHDKNKQDKNRHDGDTTSYDEMNQEDNVTPDKEAYDKDGDGSRHPAHKMGEGNEADQGQ